MKQRLGLAAALLVPRRLVVLDEPTNGLDPAGTRDVRRIVAELHAAGATVIVSSHLLAEVEATCTHVAVLQAGALVAAGELATLLDTGTGGLVVATPDVDVALNALRAAGNGVPRGARSTRSSSPTDRPRRRSSQLLVRAGVAVHEARRQPREPRGALRPTHGGAMSDPRESVVVGVRSPVTTHSRGSSRLRRGGCCAPRCAGCCAARARS